MTNATITPAAVAAAAATGSPRVGAPTAPALEPAALSTSAAALVDALAAVDSASEGDSAARGTLKRVTLERFAIHAAALSSRYDGRDVLPANLKSAAQSLVWRDATGSATPVPAKDRTPGQTSLGQYLSRFAKVATSLDVETAGIDGLASVVHAETVLDTLAEIDRAASEAKAAKLDVIAAAEYSGFLAKLDPRDRDAIARIVDLFRDGNGNSQHAATFAGDVLAAAGGAHKVTKVAAAKGDK